MTQQNVEAECFKALSDFTVTQEVESHATNQVETFHASVRTPKLLLYDDLSNTQVMEYLPNSTNLKAYINSHLNSATPAELEPHCHALGKALGHYISACHHNTDDKLRETLKSNSQMQNLKHMINYDWMLDRIGQLPEILGDAKSTFTAVKEMAWKELDHEGELMITHGDLWPGKRVVSCLCLALLADH